MSRTRRPVSLLLSLIAAAALLALPATSLARSHDHDGDNRISIFSTIDVGEGETVGDVACVFCTVNLHGDVQGDVAVLFGTVSTDTDRTLSGDVATLFSTLRVGDRTHIHGDLAAALSTVQLGSEVVVDGDRKVLASGLGLSMLIAPLLLVAGVVWLVVWIVRRVLFPAYG